MVDPLTLLQAIFSVFLVSFQILQIFLVIFTLLLFKILFLSSQKFCYSTEQKNDLGHCANFVVNQTQLNCKKTQFFDSKCRKRFKNYNLNFFSQNVVINAVNMSSNEDRKIIQLQGIERGLGLVIIISSSCNGYVAGW